MDGVLDEGGEIILYQLNRKIDKFVRYYNEDFMWSALDGYSNEEVLSILEEAKQKKCRFHSVLVLLTELFNARNNISVSDAKFVKAAQAIIDQLSRKAANINIQGI